VKTTYPDTTTVTNAYDGVGDIISVTDQAGNVVQSNYDAARQLKSVVQVNSPNTSNNTKHVCIRQRRQPGRRDGRERAYNF
jgi:YD repeat-containing protein